MQRGWTGLLGQVITFVSTFGEVCFLNYQRIADAITLSNGKRPHRESVGRVVRQAARIGIFDHKRIGPGKRPSGAKYASSHGTTENRLLSTRLGVKRIAKSVRSRLRCQAVAVLAVVATPAPNQDPAPRYALPPKLAALLDTRAPEAHPSSSSFPRRPPPGLSPEERLAWLEREMASDDRKRGPPA